MPKYSLTLNDKTVEIDASPDMPLLWALRDVLGLTGTKFGCGAGLCGACTVHVNDKAQRSCLYTVSMAANQNIRTIEGLSSGNGNALKQAWVDLDVPQCGYCQCGQIMSASALLGEIPKPSDRQIDDAMSGNICRCGTYPRIKKAIKSVAYYSPKTDSVREGV